MAAEESKNEVLQVLQQIEQVLLKQDAGAAALWAILTALRGHDSDNHAYSVTHDKEYEYRVTRDKEYTTGRIRTLVFPLLAKLTKPNLGYYWPAFGAPVRPVVPDEYGHFEAHVREAVKALEFLELLPAKEQHERTENQ